LVDVVLEFVLLDGNGDDLVDALDVGGLGETGGVLADDRDSERPLEPARSADELERDRAELASEMLGDDEDAQRARSIVVPSRSARHSRAQPRYARSGGRTAVAPGGAPFAVTSSAAPRRSP
jgi:hypothetical protein